MLGWLKATHESAQETYEDSAIYLHPNPISFSTSEQKQGWIGFQEEVEKRDSATKFAKVGDHKAKLWVALCDTANQSYVGVTLSQEERDAGVRQWDKVEWHTWGLAIVQADKGKWVYIFDCDQKLPEEEERFHIKDLTSQAQREFLRAMMSKEGGLNVQRAFVGNGGGGLGGKDQCLSHTTQWIEALAGEDGVGASPDDKRFEGFVEIGLNV